MNLPFNQNYILVVILMYFTFGQMYYILVVILMRPVTYFYADYNICYSIYNQYYV